MAQARHDAEMEYPATPPAKCPDCAASFPNHQTMIQHMGREFRRSNGHTHVHCLECKKYLRSYDALNAHLKRVSSYTIPDPHIWLSKKNLEPSERPGA